eukprot:TRINITY_DN2581_c0_g1_i4.p1 TRINITY_DN2581_c0_g1~~TRINITY_DN2581_c0_g1_i4.p1  ORF type:complete len:136 (+),score=31.58 TRINITY_DN2581_c0_g1_i4:283-690(+)
MLMLECWPAAVAALLQLLLCCLAVLPSYAACYANGHLQLVAAGACCGCRCLQPLPEPNGRQSLQPPKTTCRTACANAYAVPMLLRHACVACWCRCYVAYAAVAAAVCCLPQLLADTRERLALKWCLRCYWQVGNW